MEDAGAPSTCAPGNREDCAAAPGLTPRVPGLVRRTSCVSFRAVDARPSASVVVVLAFVASLRLAGVFALGPAAAAAAAEGEAACTWRWPAANSGVPFSPTSGDRSSRWTEVAPEAEPSFAGWPRPRGDAGLSPPLLPAGLAAPLGRRLRVRTCGWDLAAAPPPWRVRDRAAGRLEVVAGGAWWPAAPRRRAGDRVLHDTLAWRRASSSHANFLPQCEHGSGCWYAASGVSFTRCRCVSYVDRFWMNTRLHTFTWDVMRPRANVRLQSGHISISWTGGGVGSGNCTPRVSVRGVPALVVPSGPATSRPLMTGA